MIRSTIEEPHFLVKFTNGTGAGFADVPVVEGGTGTSFRPHELLEAALATCITITLRMYAMHHGVPLEDVAAEVSVEHRATGETVFHYDVKLEGSELTPEARAKLLDVAAACPVHRALAKPIRFERESAAEAEPPAARPAVSTR